MNYITGKVILTKRLYPDYFFVFVYTVFFNAHCEALPNLKILWKYCQLFHSISQEGGCAVWWCSAYDNFLLKIVRSVNSLNSYICFHLTTSELSDTPMIGIPTEWVRNWIDQWVTVHITISTTLAAPHWILSKTASTNSSHFSSKNMNIFDHY